MNIKSLKELEAAMKLCAKHGIRTLKIGNIEMQIELPAQPELKTEQPSDTQPASNYTDEDYLLWSVPSADPGA